MHYFFCTLTLQGDTMGEAAYIPETEPFLHNDNNPDHAIIGGSVLKLAESEPSDPADLQDFVNSLTPHESLGLQHLQHERAILKRINAALPDDHEGYRASSNPTVRINNYIGQEIELVPAGPREKPIRNSRRLLINYELAVQHLRAGLSEDHPAQHVFDQYQEAARTLKKPRSDERLLTDGVIRMHIFHTLTMMDEKSVRHEIDRQVEAAKSERTV